MLGFKACVRGQVSQKANTFSRVELRVGPLKVTHEWPPQLEEKIESVLTGSARVLRILTSSAQTKCENPATKQAGWMWDLPGSLAGPAQWLPPHSEGT